MKKRVIQGERAERENIMRKIVGEAAYETDRDVLEQADAVQEAARFIRQMRNHAELNQTQLGERIGVSQERISEMERGGSPEGVSYALLRRVARACGFPDWPNPPVREEAGSEMELFDLDDNSFDIIPLYPGGTKGKVTPGDAVTVHASYAKGGKKIEAYHISVDTKLGPFSVQGRLKPKRSGPGLSEHGILKPFKD